MFDSSRKNQVEGSKYNKEHSPSDKMYNALIADIGGTNVRFRIISFTIEVDTPIIVAEDTYSTLDWKSINDAI